MTLGPQKPHCVGFGVGLRFNGSLRFSWGPIVSSPCHCRVTWDFLGAGLERATVGLGGRLCSVMWGQVAPALGRGTMPTCLWPGESPTALGCTGESPDSSRQAGRHPLPWVGLQALSHGFGGEACLTLLLVIQAAEEILEGGRKRRPRILGGWGSPDGVRVLGSLQNTLLAPVNTFISIRCGPTLVGGPPPCPSAAALCSCWVEGGWGGPGSCSVCSWGGGLSLPWSSEFPSPCWNEPVSCRGQWWERPVPGWSCLLPSQQLRIVGRQNGTPPGRDSP